MKSGHLFDCLGDLADPDSFGFSGRASDLWLFCLAEDALFLPLSSDVGDTSLFL